MPNAAELHRTLFHSIRARDFDALGHLYHPDCVYRIGDGVEKTGPAAVVGDVQAFTTAFPDLTIEIKRQVAPSDEVSVVEYVFSGTHDGPLDSLQATGRRIEVVACSVIDARDDQIVREHDYYDFMALMHQLDAAQT